jgi:hypothetical protein
MTEPWQRLGEQSPEGLFARRFAPHRYPLLDAGHGPSSSTSKPGKKVFKICQLKNESEIVFCTKLGLLIEIILRLLKC